MKKIISIMFLFGILSQAAVAADCISKAEMQEIASHFTQFRDQAGSDYCYDGSQLSGLLQALMFMRKTEWQKPMTASPDELFSGRFANDWYQYFIGRINDITIESDCPKGVGAFVYMWGDSAMHVCPMLLTTNFTALDRSSVMMHEARHIDGFPHITCTRGARAGLQGACDDKISTAGSYAVTVETYAQLARYAIGINPALKAYARASAATYADETFENPARVTKTQQFLVMTNDKQFHVVQGKGATRAIGSSPALGHIVMRAQHMILFPDDKTQPAKYVFAHNEGDIQQTAGDLVVEYNNGSPAERANLVDMHIAAQWSARVYKNKVRFLCDPRSNSVSELSLNGIDPAAIVYPQGYDRAAQTAQLMDTNGKLYTMSCANKQASLKPSNQSMDRTYKQIHKANDLLLGLGQDGRLYEIRGTSSMPFTTALDGQVHDLVPNQFVEFLDAN